MRVVVLVVLLSLCSSISVYSQRTDYLGQLDTDDNGYTYYCSMPRTYLPALDYTMGEACTICIIETFGDNGNLDVEQFIQASWIDEYSDFGDTTYKPLHVVIEAGDKRYKRSLERSIDPYVRDYGNGRWFVRQSYTIPNFPRVSKVTIYYGDTQKCLYSGPVTYFKNVYESVGAKPEDQY